MELVALQIDQIMDGHSIKEIGFMTTSQPPFVVSSEDNLGISVSVLKPLYKYALIELNRIVITGDDQSCIMGITKLLSLSRLALLIKGDLPMAFKYRKLAMQNNHLDVRDEINFLSLLFTKHPKSPSGWFHRRWCLGVHCTRMNRTQLNLSEIETEREICRQMAERNPKNYYAWTHRQWLLLYMSDNQVLQRIPVTRYYCVCDRLIVSYLLVGGRARVYEGVAGQPRVGPLGCQPPHAGHSANHRRQGWLFQLQWWQQQ